MDVENSPVGDKARGRPTHSDKEVIDWLEKNIYHYQDDGEQVTITFKSGCKNERPENWLRKQISNVIDGEQPDDIKPVCCVCGAKPKNIKTDSEGEMHFYCESCYEKGA